MTILGYTKYTGRHSGGQGSMVPVKICGDGVPSNPRKFYEHFSLSGVLRCIPGSYSLQIMDVYREEEHAHPKT